MRTTDVVVWGLIGAWMSAGCTSSPASPRQVGVPFGVPTDVASADTGGAADSGAVDGGGAVDIASGGGVAQDATSSAPDTASSSADTGSADGYDPIHKLMVVQHKCAEGLCHNISAGGLELSAKDVDGSYKALMKGVAQGLFKHECGAQKYVLPGKPEQSLLWLKVDAKAIHGCGNKMPPEPGKGAVSAAASAAVKAWIVAGAKR